MSDMYDEDEFLNYHKKDKRSNKTMEINGVLLRVFPTKNVGKYKITDFVVKKSDGVEVKCTTFGSVPTAALGGDVSFQATPDDRGKPVVNRGTHIEIVEGDTDANTTTAVAEPALVAKAPARRGRPAKSAVDTTARSTDAPVVANADAKLSGRDAYRDEAVKSVSTNLALAIQVASELKITDYTISDLVALGDMIGRTQTAIFMDAKKDTRSASFSK